MGQFQWLSKGFYQFLKCPTIAVASPRVVELSIAAMLSFFDFPGNCNTNKSPIDGEILGLLYSEGISEFESSAPEAKSLYSSWNFFDPKIWIPSHGFKIFDRLLIWARTNTITQGQAPLYRKSTTSLPFLRKTSPKNLRPFFPCNILLFVYIHIHDTQHSMREAKECRTGVNPSFRKCSHIFLNQNKPCK